MGGKILFQHQQDNFMQGLKLIAVSKVGDWLISQALSDPLLNFSFFINDMTFSYFLSSLDNFRCGNSYSSLFLHFANLKHIENS